jgi:hypothetical protein
MGGLKASSKILNKNIKINFSHLFQSLPTTTTKMKIGQNEGASSKCWTSNSLWVGLKTLSKILEKMSNLTTFSKNFQAPSTLKNP